MAFMILHSKTGRKLIETEFSVSCDTAIADEIIANIAVRDAADDIRSITDRILAITGEKRLSFSELVAGITELSSLYEDFVTDDDEPSDDEPSDDEPSDGQDLLSRVASAPPVRMMTIDEYDELISKSTV